MKFLKWLFGIKSKEKENKEKKAKNDNWIVDCVIQYTSTPAF